MNSPCPTLRLNAKFEYLLGPEVIIGHDPVYLAHPICLAIIWMDFIATIGSTRLWMYRCASSLLFEQSHQPFNYLLHVRERSLLITQKAESINFPWLLFCGQHTVILFQACGVRSKLRTCKSVKEAQGPLL